MRLGTDGRWEFKQIEFRGNRPVGPNRDSLADELAAFANGNGGVLLCGVTDDGRVQGMTRAQLDAVEQLVITCTDVVELVLAQPLQSGDLVDGSDEVLNGTDGLDHQDLFWQKTERVVP